MGTPIPHTDHVARYCPPSTVEDGVPTSNSFRLRANEEYLSVNWIEHSGRHMPTAVDTVRVAFQNKGYSLRRNGRFAVLNVGQIVSTVRAALSLRVEHMPECDDPSHSGILWDHGTDELRVAQELSMLCAASGNVFQAIT